MVNMLMGARTNTTCQGGPGLRLATVYFKNSKASKYTNNKTLKSFTLVLTSFKTANQKHAKH